MEWRAKNLSFRFPRRPIVMGVLNVTPDSFSDGSHFLDPGSAVDRAFRMVDEGADMVDIGGESTRPGATPVGEAEELRRLLPVLERLGRQFPVPISVDTRKSTVARVVLEAGASLINDIEAARGSEAMWQTVASAGAGYVAMHMQGTPETMQADPSYPQDDVVGEVAKYLSARREAALGYGVDSAAIILDPGLGFGKTVAHNLALIRGIPQLIKIGSPILLGHSRKSFLGKITGGEKQSALEERLAAGLAVTALARSLGASLFRVHEVRLHLDALRFAEALAGNH